MLEWYAQCRSIMFAFQELWWHAMPDVVRLCMFSKGYDGMPRPTSSDPMYCPRAMMACQARRRPTMCAFQGPWWHAHHPSMCAVQGRWCNAIPNFIRPYVLSKVYDVSLAWRYLTVCAVQRILWHSTLDIAGPCAQSKCDNAKPHPMSLDLG